MLLGKESPALGTKCVLNQTEVYDTGRESWCDVAFSTLTWQLRHVTPGCG